MDPEPASGAGAFAVNMVARGSTTSLSASDTVTVDIFLDADGPMVIFSVAAINSNPAALLYDGPASAALPPIHGLGPSGAQPSYILYTPGKPFAFMYPLQAPHWLTFPATIPGTEQVNINFLADGFFSTLATGTGIYVATLVFHVVADFDTETLSLAFTSANLIQTGTFVHPPSTIGLSAPIVLTGQVPEPTTGILIALGCGGVGLAGLRRV